MLDACLSISSLILKGLCCRSISCVFQGSLSPLQTSEPTDSTHNNETYVFG